MLFYVFTDYSKHIRAVCDIIYAVSLKRWERTMPKGIQKLIQRAKLSLKRSILRSRKRRAAFKKAGGFRYACSGFIRALRARSPRAFMSLAGILLMLALVIIIPVTLAQGGRERGRAYRAFGKCGQHSGHAHAGAYAAMDRAYPRTYAYARFNG